MLSDNNYSDNTYFYSVRDPPASRDPLVFLVRRGPMIFAARLMVLIALSLSLTTPVLAAQSNENTAAAARDKLQQYVAELKKNPANTALRKQIILLALSMKPAPAVPEDAERNISQGTTFLEKAGGAAGYNRAIVEFQAAANSAPWLAIAYLNLGMIQEKVGFYAEAVQNLKFYLMAAPDAVNAREVMNKVSTLKAEVEELHTDRDEFTRASSAAEPVPVADPPSAKPVPVAVPPLARKTTPAVKPDMQQSINKIPPAVEVTSVPVQKKHGDRSFIGSWFFKDTIRGEERTTQAFRISADENGNIVPVAPKRPADYVPTIWAFEITDTRMKIEIHWRLTSVVGYWKVEIFDLTLSEDGTKLTGPVSEKSVGGRHINLDRTFFRQ